VAGASCHYSVADDDDDDAAADGVGMIAPNHLPMFNPVLEVEVAVSVRDVDEDRARKFVHFLRFDHQPRVAAGADDEKGSRGRWARGAPLPQELPQEVSARRGMAPGIS
jgi:hypothetical protein